MADATARANAAHVIAAGLMVVSVIASALADEPSALLRPGPFMGPEPTITDDYIVDQYQKLDENIRANDLRPEDIGAVPGICEAPIQIAIQYWVTNGRSDWKIMKAQLRPEQFAIAEFLTHTSSMRNTVENSPARTINWLLNRKRLQKACKGWFEHQEIRDKAADIQRQADELEKQINGH